MDDKCRTSSTFSELIALFPYTSARPTQIAALQSIARMFDEGTRMYVNWLSMRRDRRNRRNDL